MSRVYFTRRQFIQLISQLSCLSPGFILTGIPFCCSEFFRLWLVGKSFLEIFEARKFGMGFWGVNFWSRDFLGSWEALGIFWVLIFAPIRSSPSNPEYPPEKQVFQAVLCSWFLGEAEMTSYQDEHAPIKFMTGVSLNIIMGFHPSYSCYLSTFRRGKWLSHKNWRNWLLFETKKLLLWVSHMFLVTPRSPNTSWKVVPASMNFCHYSTLKP